MHLNKEMWTVGSRYSRRQQHKTANKWSVDCRGSTFCDVTVSLNDYKLRVGGSRATDTTVLKL